MKRVAERPRIERLTSIETTHLRLRTSYQN